MTQEIKLLASDLDGTLFYPKRRVKLIASKNQKFIERFLGEGNRLVLVTGRSPAFAQKVFQKLGHEVDVIGMNGAYTIIDGEVENEHFLDFPISKMLFDLNALFPILGTMLISKKYPLLISTPPVGKFLELFYRFYYWSMGNYAEDYHFSNEEFVKQIHTKEVYKLMIFFGISKRGERLASKANEYLRTHYNHLFEASWTGGFIEITPLGSSKAESIKRYIESKNIPHENVYVVGDSGNDISMFKEFYNNSFCLKHAHKKVKKHANTIIRRFHHLEKHI